MVESSHAELLEGNQTRAPPKTTNSGQSMKFSQVGEQTPCVLQDNSGPHSSGTCCPSHTQDSHAGTVPSCGRVGSLLNKEDGSELVAPSAIPGRAQIFTEQKGLVDLDPPRALATGEVPQVIAEYRQAALNAREAGLDGVEFHCSSGYLPMQFLSSGTNQRTDEYGGSLENRARFAMEVLTACRKRVGEAFLLGVRYTADEVETGGITAEEGIALAKMFKTSGLVDFVNIIRGRVHTDTALTDVIPIHGMKSAPHLDFAGRIRAEVDESARREARFGPGMITTEPQRIIILLDLVKVLSFEVMRSGRMF